MKGSKNIKIWLPYTVSILCSILFIYAATSKLWDFQQFKVQLGQSPILTAYANWIAWVVPVSEYIIAFLLLLDRYRLIALYVTLGLMTMFTTYIILVLNFSDYIPCSCGGVLENLGWTEHVIFNTLFIIISIMAIVQLESKTMYKPLQS
ncbi:MauE/DoxX family redox-associated membrane protein [Allomuricauda sp. NBRC 101325]|uniref:MauE/DoxX family redox-associated membrane protein n=1 Tax=Allomuricauda sp. NBRC 101325 TaxID=1113758 RepID=UPI002553B0DF|nr:MauE/DoxX family redox-associated membrane protein [Muricauda sp. NBRC 101325]